MDSYLYGRFASATQKTDEPETASVKFVRMLPFLWFVGTVLIAGYIFFRSIRLWRIVKHERPITDSEILDLLEDCKMQMGVQTILGVVVSDRIKSPALFGFIRPRLLLPQGMLETFGQEELRYVFIHELAHLKQRDIYLGWLMALLHVVHWFNPLMWFAFGRMRADREMACDRLAISTMAPDEPPEYGRTIVSLLESFSQVRYLPSVAGILEEPCQMERRIKMIADYKKTSRTRLAGSMLLLAVLAGVVLTNAYVAKADFTFGTPTNLGLTINSAFEETVVCLSPDDLEMYFISDRPGSLGNWDIWVTKRESADADWGPPENLGPTINSPKYESGTHMSPDGLTLYFQSERAGGMGSCDIWTSTRVSKDDPWVTPVNLGSPVNSVYDEDCPAISADGLELFFFAWGRPGGAGKSDIWVSTRPSVDDPWGEPTNLGSVVNTVHRDEYIWLSPDGLLIIFDSDRPGGSGGFDLWITRRASRSDPWTTPVNLGSTINGPYGDGLGAVSPDRHMFYFASNRPGGLGGLWGDIWQAPIIPIVDFNGDGNIDTDDLVILVNNWGTNERLCDIGPTPLGDGIVDMKDLEVFMSYWEQENMPEIP